MRPFLLVAAVAALFTVGCDRQNAAQSEAGATKGAEAEAGKPGVSRGAAGTPIPTVVIKDSDGQDTTLADIADGKPMLVNLWATWCAPCVKELPTLDTLADRPGAPQVIALSQDMQSQDKVAAFLNERKIGLEAIQDSEMAVSTRLGVQILPTTILYGSDGREIWRYTGDLDWTGTQAAGLLREAR